jgi:hypothetical protein
MYMPQLDPHIGMNATAGYEMAHLIALRFAQIWPANGM